MARAKLIPLLLAVLVAVAACGGTTQTPSPTAAPAAPAPTAAPAAPAATSAPAAPATTAAPAAPAGDLQVDRSKLSAELKFYTWTDYIDPSIIEEFEKEYGVKVIMDVFDANEDMIAKVKTGNSGYDIVVPSDYAVEIMWRDGLLQPIDKALIPNLANVDPELLNKYFDEGNKFSVPYMYGISGLAYNKAKFQELGLPAPDSWSALFDVEQLKKYQEKDRQQGGFGVSMLDDERETPGAALKYLGKSLNDTNPESLQKAEEILKTQKDYIAAYNSSDVNRKLAGGEYVISHAWSGMAMQARNGLGSEFPGNPDIVFVMPKEGGMIWMDNLAILRDSPHAYTAHVFMNYLLRPDISARNTEYIGYLTPNLKARDLLSPETKERYAEGFAPDAEMYKRLEWAVRNETTKAFTDLWTSLKGQ